MRVSVVTVYYTQGVPATCVGHTYDHLLGGALQRIVIYRHITRRYEVLNFENNARFKIHIKD
jgi:hypothetical protein